LLKRLLHCGRWKKLIACLVGGSYNEGMSVRPIRGRPGPVRPIRGPRGGSCSASCSSRSVALSKRRRSFSIHAPSALTPRRGGRGGRDEAARGMARIRRELRSGRGCGHRYGARRRLGLISRRETGGGESYNSERYPSSPFPQPFSAGTTGFRRARIDR
jgi:hypothetical protein